MTAVLWISYSNVKLGRFHWDSLARVIFVSQQASEMAAKAAEVSKVIMRKGNNVTSTIRKQQTSKLV